MVTDVEDKLNTLVREYCDDRCSLDLLMFLGKHPYARFDRMAIACSIDGQRLNVDRPLKQLILDGLVSMAVENGMTVYSLAENASMAELGKALVKELVNLDWNRRQMLLGNYN